MAGLRARTPPRPSLHRRYPSSAPAAPRPHYNGSPATPPPALDTLVNAPRAAGPLELHRLLTFLGVALLVATFAIYYNEGGYGGGDGSSTGSAADPVGDSDGFSMAYVTGVAMLAVFMASFVLFNKEKLGGRGRGRKRRRG